MNARRVKKTDEQKQKQTQAKQHPFRRAVLRGLGVVLPPLLTIVLFIWAWTTIERYVLRPMEAGAHQLIVWRIADIQDPQLPTVLPCQEVRRERDHVFVRRNDGGVAQVQEAATSEVRKLTQGRWYVKLESGRVIPKDVFDTVDASDELLPKTSADFYSRYVELRYMRRLYVIPVFLLLFVLCLYMLGKFLAAGAGRMLWNLVENIIQRLPIIRNVYSAVKQVTDFVFSEREIEFNRVVAVEYPRKGIWSLGFVTGESMLDIRSAANEPVMSVLMPTSPMPATGFTITVPKSETIDLDITIDQAIQFIVSCGVVVPGHQQQQNAISAQISAAIARRRSEQHDGQQAPGRGVTPVANTAAGEENGEPRGVVRRGDAAEAETDR